MSGPGWIGPLAAVSNYLAVIGADKAEDGSRRIEGAIAFGLDPTEVVIGVDAVYFVGGVRRQLAAGLASTSQGVAVMVFM